MAISTVSLQQSQHSYEKFSTKREIKALDQSKLPLTQAAISSAEASKVLKAEADKSKTEENELLNYDRPLTPKLALLKMLVEGMTGKELNLSYQAFDFEQHSSSLISNANNLTSSDLISIDGNNYHPEQLLAVTESRALSQGLNYQMSGEFIIDNNKVSLNFNWAVAQESISTTYRELTAATLKDPLVIQFGEQNIGNIEQHIKFDLIAENKDVNLPMFSGDIGYLVYDKNQNNRADNGSELFGPTTNNGFAELATFDNNKDGFIDASDEIYESLYVWRQDNNQTLWLSLADANIKAISTAAIETPFNFYDNNHQKQASIRQSSFAITAQNEAKIVHQIDVNV